MDELASLQESARKMALERFRIIQPHLEQDRSLSLIARTTNIPYRTMHRWLTRYRRFGLAALARKAREDRGKRRTLSPRLLEVAEALALEVPPLPIAAIYRRICQIAKDTGNSAPSYDVIYEVVRQVPAGLLTLAHEGKKAYSAAFDLVHRREAERPNAIWQADHTLLDILVQRDGENPAQPWLTVILDDHSRALAGYFLFFEAPSAAQTALARPSRLSKSVVFENVISPRDVRLLALVTLSATIRTTVTLATSLRNEEISFILFLQRRISCLTPLHSITLGPRLSRSAW
jgi:putative transposase